MYFNCNKLRNKQYKKINCHVYTNYSCVMMITQRDDMKKDILLKQKIGLRLSRAGHLSKLFAIQTFKKSEPDLRPFTTSSS